MAILRFPLLSNSFKTCEMLILKFLLMFIKAKPVSEKIEQNGPHNPACQQAQETRAVIEPRAEQDDERVSRVVDQLHRAERLVVAIQSDVCQDQCPQREPPLNFAREEGAGAEGQPVERAEIRREQPRPA